MKNYSTTLLLWSIHIHSTHALSFNPNIPHSSTRSINPNQITESFIASEYRQRVDQERYLNDQYVDRRSPKPFGRRDVIDEEYVVRSKIILSHSFLNMCKAYASAPVLKKAIVGRATICI